MPSKTKKHVDDLSRDTAGATKAAFEALNAMRRGEITPTQVNATSRVIGQMMNVARTKVYVRRFLSSVSDGDGGPGTASEPMDLG